MLLFLRIKLKRYFFQRPALLTDVRRKPVENRERENTLHSFWSGWLDFRGMESAVENKFVIPEGNVKTEFLIKTSDQFENQDHTEAKRIDFGHQFY